MSKPDNTDVEVRLDSDDTSMEEVSQAVNGKSRKVRSTKKGGPCTRRSQGKISLTWENSDSIFL